MTQNIRAKPSRRGSKLMLSGALLLGSGAYVWSQHGDQPMAGAPVAETHGTAAPVKTASQAAPAPLPAAVQSSAPEAAPPPDAAAQAQPQSPPADSPPRRQTSPAEAPPQAPVVLASRAAAPAPPPVQPPAHYASGDFTGESTDTAWGLVQVRVSVRDGAITAIDPIDYPQHRNRSIEINEWALPVLEREVIQAQSADVDIVSQATTTSLGYMQSLTTALAQAKK
jgi:uncharacterized protein with FMN-binding domain